MEKKASRDKPVESSSFAMNLFRGQLRTEEIFPFPYSLNEEQRDNLQALVDPTAKFFEVFISNSFYFVPRSSFTFNYLLGKKRRT
jgi:hypothetical protein